MRVLRSVLTLVTLIPSLASAQILGRDAEVFTRNEAVARGEWFRFYGPIGDVTVTEGTGTQVEFRAEKILRNGRVTDIGFELRRTGEGVTICALFDDGDECSDNGYRSDRRRNWGRNFRPPSLNVTIRVPAGVRLAVHSGNGDIAVTGAHAELIARSENVRGPVSANSGVGDGRVTTVQGPVSARSGNGDLIVRMTELRVADDMEFTTEDGRIEVTVPAGFNADIDASTGNGGILTDFPIQVQGRISKTRMRGTIGQGGRRLRLITGNGEIELRRAGG